MDLPDSSENLAKKQKIEGEPYSTCVIATQSQLCSPQVFYLNDENIDMTQPPSPM